jgi:hypothetical protein
MCPTSTPRLVSSRHQPGDDGLQQRVQLVVSGRTVGYRPTVHGDGAAAEASVPATIVPDLMLPGMDELAL